jgi:hypothetical protein
VEVVFADGVDGVKAVFISCEADRAHLLPVYFFNDIFKFIELGPDLVVNYRIVVIVGFDKCHPLKIFLPLPVDPQLYLKSAQCEQIVLSADIIMEKLNVYKQGGDEMQDEYDSEEEG